MTTLNVIEGDYGLLSLDVSCIQSILYAKLKQIQVKVKYMDNVKSCALYTAPSLSSENAVVKRFHDIVLHWQNIYGDLDQQLSPKERSQTLGLTNLITLELKPALEYFYWVDNRNCEEFVSRWFMKALPFPFNYSYTKRRKNEARNLIEAFYPLDTDMDVIKEFVVKTAAQCLSTLSSRLGKSQFFYGDSPKTLDVIVYSYIAPLVKLPFPSNDMASLLTMWPNLTEFVKRIDVMYFPELKQETKYLQRETSSQQNDDEVSYVAIFILIVSASSLVFALAIKRGFIKMQ